MNLQNPSASNIPCPPTTAAAVANEFIELGLQDSSFPQIDQMKLQKLLFYAHATYLANCLIPLFEEDFEAWPWGPVVRDIYFQTRDYGRGPVTAKVSEIKKTDKGDFGFVTPEGVPPELKSFVKAIWNAMKKYTGIQLSNATHAPGEPWTIMREQYNGDLSFKPTIPNQLIMEVFKKKITNANTAAG